MRLRWDEMRDHSRVRWTAGLDEGWPVKRMADVDLTGAATDRSETHKLMLAMEKTSEIVWKSIKK